MKKNISLNGIIDMHVHTAPDICQRTYNDLELTAIAARSGVRAIVIKGHHNSTMTRAALCNAYNRTSLGSNSFVMYGGLVLNYEAGGLNPKAVKTALELGAKVIWLPTVDAENDYRKHGRSGGIHITDNHGMLVTELHQIFSLIKEYNAVLATGHISPEETRCVVDSARNIGVQKIVITHPEYWVVDMSLETQRQLIQDYHIIMERCFMQPLKNGEWVNNAACNLEAIRQLGAESTILSTDCGNPATPPWEEAMEQYLQFMVDHNIDPEELRSMTQITPAHLLGLTDVVK